jgi:LmbE family N-acetylglucosaminyl deacetylase
MAGTIARLTAEGHGVHIFIPGEGRSEATGSTVAEIMALHDSALAASTLLGAKFIEEGALTLPDNQLDTVPLLDVAKLVGGVVQRLRPDVVYTHHAGDLNVDHRIIHEAVLIATRPQRPHYPQRVLTFAVPSSTEWTFTGSFRPTVYVDISATLKRKLDAVRIYEAELRPFPHPRSVRAVRALARWRGATVGVPAAEAFELVREISC